MRDYMTALQRRFLDAEHSFRGTEKIDAFVAGFRLADGVRTELGAPYS